jgi:hypothetical protein
MIDLNVVQLAQIRYNELLQEAEQARRARQARAGQPSLQARLLLNVGNYLISSGQKLKARYQPDMADPSFQWVSR